VGPDHQHRIGAALVASPAVSAYVAAKHGIAGQNRRARSGGARHHDECDLPRLSDAAGRKQIPDTAKARGLTEAQVINALLHAQPTKQFSK
jgi:3-hydroxybutyrate dehydrogenase